MTENNDCKILELDHPHGFLVWRGKQTALGTPESLPVGEKLLVVSEGEAFGYVTLKPPAQMKSSEFDREEYHKEHRLYPTEWRLIWPDTTTLNLYRFESWEPFEKAMPFENGEIITYEPTPHEAALIDKSRQLPKTLVLNDEAITMTGGKFVVAADVSVPEDFKQILQATYETEVEFVGQKQGKYLPLYRLALVRVPNIRVKKNEGQVETIEDDKQAGEDMPYRKVRNHPKCPSSKPWGLVNKETGRLEGCHKTEADAQGQIAAMHLGKSAEEQDEDIKEPLPMPYPNEHAARINAPGKYQRVRRQNDKFGSGIDVIFGVLPGGKTEVQAIRFDKTKFTPAQARAWLRDHDYKPTTFEPATGKSFDEDMVEDEKNYGGWDEAMPYMHESDDTSGATSFSELMALEQAEENAEDVQKLTVQFQKMVVNILGNPMIDDKQVAINDLVGEFGTLVNQTMEAKKQWQPLTDLTKKALNRIFKRHEDKPEESESESDSPVDGLSFDQPYGIAVKTVNGQPWHLTWSTNAFRDRDGEIFTTKALENFVSESEQSGYKGFFDFWHIKGTDFATKEWKAVIGRILVEAGPYFDNEAGRQAKAFFQQYPEGHSDIAPEGWGASPEFKYLPEERAKDGIFHWLWITRTSTLPRAAAANIWTKGNQIMAMTKQQEEAAIAVFGKEFVANLKAQAEKETSALEQVADHKAADTPEESKEPTTQTGTTETAQVEDEPEGADTEEEEETEESESDDGEAVPVGNVNVEELASEVKKQFEMDLEPVAQAMAEILAEVKAVADRVTKLEKTEATKQQVETPRFMLNLVRASQAEETAVGEGDDLKGQKPKETQPKKDGTLMGNFFPGPK